MLLSAWLGDVSAACIEGNYSQQELLPAISAMGEETIRNGTSFRDDEFPWWICRDDGRDRISKSCWVVECVAS